MAAAALLARLQTDLTAARKAQDKARLLLLGTIISDVRNREIELRAFRTARERDANRMKQRLPLLSRARLDRIRRRPESIAIEPRRLRQ